MLEQRGRERIDLGAVLSEQGDHFLLRLVGYARYLLVDELLCMRRYLGATGEEGPAEAVPRDHRDGPTAALIPQRPTIWRAISRSR